MTGVHPQSRSRPRNSTAGLLSMLAMGAATMVTQMFRPSNRALSRMRRARMARRFRNYQWEEAGKDGREVRLYIPVDQTINEKHVEIELSEQRLRVALKTEPVIDSDLFDSVHPQESHWFIDRHNSHACVAVTLMKKNMWNQWPFLTTQEAASCLSLKYCYCDWFVSRFCENTDCCAVDWIKAQIVGTRLLTEVCACLHWENSY